MGTIINTPQTKTNILPTTRKAQMVWLAALTSITLVGQYILLGLTGLGESREALPFWFNSFELTLWGLRGLVEIAVVVYIAMTTTSNKTQGKVLIGFEIALITLIVFTVGPIWATGPLNVGIVDILGRWGVIIWGAGLAGISAIMLAGVATAYKFQPIEEGFVVVTLADRDRMFASVETANKERDKAFADVAGALVERDNALVRVDAITEAAAIFQHLNATSMVKVVSLFAGERPPAETLAASFGLTQSTVRGIYSKIDKGE